MKRHASDARGGARRSPDAKRQRYDRGNSSGDDAQRRYSSNDSYARRTDRYAPPPRHTDAALDCNAERERRDAQEPSYARASSNTYSSSGGRDQSRTSSSSASATNVRLLGDAKETDPHRLAQRQKQIDYGKNTVGYDLYCAAVPRHTRRRGQHPMTPDKTLNVSKKAFDGMVRKWRQALHTYDPPELQSDAASTNTVELATPREASAQQTQGAAASTVDSVATESSSSSSGKADLDRGCQAEAAGAPISHDAPRHSIYDNFVEDGDDVGDNDDDDDDDLL